MDASVISRSSHSELHSETSRELITGRSARIDTIFPIYDQMHQMTHIPKILLGVVAIYFYLQVAFSALWPEHEFWEQFGKDTFVGELLDILMYVFLFRGHTYDADGQLILCCLIVGVGLVCYGWMVVCLVYYLRNHRIPTWFLYPARALTECVAPVMLHPTAAFVGENFVRLVHTDDKVLWIYVICGIIFYAGYAVLFSVSFSLSARSASITLSPYSMFEPSSFVMLSAMSSMFLIFQFVFSIFASWVLIVVQVCHMITLGYIMWMITFLPFHVTLSSALAESVLTCGIVADVVAIITFFAHQLPGWVPFVALLLCFIISMIVFMLVFNKKVKMIKNILSVDVEMPEQEKLQRFDEYRIDRDENYALMFLTVGFTQMCDCLLDWSLVHYIADHFDTNRTICSLVQIMAFFPGESRKLNSLFSRALKRRDLEIANRFLIYQVYRINTLRQSSTSLQASEKLSELKNQTLQCEMNVRSFWICKNPSVSHFEKLNSDFHRLRALWQEGIRDYPNNAKFCDEYTRFLIECATDFEAAILQKYRAEQIDSGVNFAIDLGFRSMVRSFPRYLKDGILDLKGNVVSRKKKASGSNSATATHQSSSEHFSSTSSQTLDVEVEEGIGKRIITQSKMRLALHHSTEGRILKTTRAMTAAIIICCITCMVGFIGVFVYNKTVFVDRKTSMVRISDLSKVRFFTSLANSALFMHFLQVTGRLSNLHVLANAQRVDAATNNMHDMISMVEPFLESVIKHSYEARIDFYALLQDISDLSDEGYNVYDLAQPLMENVVDIVVCHNGQKIRNRKGNLKMTTLYIIFDQAAMTYAGDVANWYMDDRYCQLLSNWMLMMDGAKRLFQTMSAFQFQQGEDLGRILMILMIVSPSLIFISIFVPTVILSILFVKQMNGIAKIMVNLDPAVKEQTMKPLRSNASNESEETHDIKVGPSVGFLITCILGSLGLLTAALSLGQIYYSYEMNHDIESMNDWQNFASQRLSSCSEGLLLAFQGLVLNGSVQVKFTSRETLLNAAQDWLQNLEEMNAALVSGTDTTKPCMGYDETLDALNFEQSCETSDTDHGERDMHDDYRCASANIGVSYFKQQLGDMIRRIDKYHGSVQDDVVLHIVHMANTHLWYRLRESINRILVMAEEAYDKLVSVEAIFMVAGLFAMLFCMLFMRYVQNLMHSATRACISLLKRIPPLDIINNRDILNFLLDRSITQKEQGMSMTQRVVHKSPDAIIFTGLTGVIEIVNAGVTTIFGFTPEQLLGQLPGAVIAPEDSDKIMNQLELMKNKQSSPVYEDKVSCVTDDGTYLPCAITLLSMTKAGSNDVQSFVIVLRDESALSKQQKIAEEAKAQSENLLFQILPRDIVVKLNQGESEISFTVPSASVMFIDIVKFSDYASSLTPQEIMGNLSQVFAAFDAAAKKYSLVTKIKLIGDVYMAAAGLFSVDSPPQSHAEETLRFGLDCLHELDEVNMRLNANLAVRIGVNSGGPILAGVLGTDKPVFDIIGDPINVAARLQSTDIPGHIQIPQSTYDLVSGLDFSIEKRGEVFLKGKGATMAYLVAPVDPLTNNSSNIILSSLSRDSLLIELITTTGDLHDTKGIEKSISMTGGGLKAAISQVKLNDH